MSVTLQYLALFRSASRESSSDNWVFMAAASVYTEDQDQAMSCCCHWMQVQVRVEDIYGSTAPMSESRCSFVVAKAVGNTEADAGLGSCLHNTRARSEPSRSFHAQSRTEKAHIIGE